MESTAADTTTFRTAIAGTLPPAFYTALLVGWNKVLASAWLKSTTAAGARRVNAISPETVRTIGDSASGACREVKNRCDKFALTLHFGNVPEKACYAKRSSDIHATCVAAFAEM